MNNLRDRWPMAAAGMLLPLALIGCGQAPAVDPSTQPSEGRPTPSVRVVKPEPAMIHREVSQPGAIEAFEETPMFAKVAGYVKDWNVDIGDLVRKDQVLAVLWVPELEVELQQKEKLIQQAEEQVEQARKAAAAAEAAVKSAEAQIQEAVANQERAVAERKRARSQALRLARTGTGVIDKESVEEAQLGYEAAQAGVKQAEARIQTTRALRDESQAKWDRALADVRVAEANREVARKNRDYVKAQVGYLRLPSPYNGVVTQRNINTGDFVQTATAGKDRPLYVVRRTDLMRIFVQVPETDADWVQKGAAAQVRVQALRNETFTGQVTRISWSLDAATRTLRAEIDLPNPPTPPRARGGVGGGLRPGMYAYATLSTDLPSALTLPRSAIATEGEVTRGYQTYCYQVAGGKAHRLPIEVGPRDRERVEVLRKQPAKGGPWEPFTGTEEIVAGDLSEVRDGQAVTIRSAER